MAFVILPSETWMDISLRFHKQEFVGRDFSVECTYQEGAKRSGGGDPRLEIPTQTQ